MCSWENGVKGYLSESEKKLVANIDELLSAINMYGNNVSVSISIEGGNQFHIHINGTKRLCYLKANECLMALQGIYVFAKEK